MSLDISTLRQRLQQALGEEFTVGALLGEGGFAAVFRVRERRSAGRSGWPSVRNAAPVARQLADALGSAHHYGVVHRDAKPDNILLDRGGHVLVTDFGIAKAAQEASVSQLTTEGMVVGTPQYMSPEQATGDKLDSRSDIYSLGILLYQMLAG